MKRMRIYTQLVAIIFLLERKVAPLHHLLVHSYLMILAINLIQMRLGYSGIAAKKGMSYWLK
jgi:hypothetical protein